MTSYSRSGDSRRAVLPLLLAIAALAAPGCGDGPICQSEVLVIIQSPSGTIVEDSSAVDDGVQTDVSIRTTVGGDEEVTLEVLDADGEVLATATATTDGAGDATFDDVTLPDGAAQLRAVVDAGECGSDEDVVDISIVIGGDGCELSLRQTPLEVEHYAPIGVLSTANDPDPNTLGFQLDVDVTAAGGTTVELFALGASGVETSVGTETTDASGAATFSFTIDEGRQSLRVACGAASSAITTVHVDTVAPACMMTHPAAGASITPGMDDDADLSNGVQLTLEASVGIDATDVEGEAASFRVTVDGTTETLVGSDVDADGLSTVATTIDPATTPTTATIEFVTQDHAGNECAVTETYDVVYEGCDIAVVAPTGTTNVDADGDTSNGVQVDVELDVDVACAGQTVTSSCGLDDPSGIVGAGGDLTLRVEWCATSPCDVTDTCTFTVTSPAGIETSASEVIRYDDQPPAVTVQVIDPAVACPAQVTAADDVDAATAGVQIRARVVSPLATTRSLEQTDTTGTVVHDATGSGGEVVITLAAGATELVGQATDAVGNVGTSATCTVTLADIAVGFSPPAADGTVGAADGTVTGSGLTFELCGTVSEAGTTVEVEVDGGAAQAATVTGTTWCITLTLAEGSHTVVATATLAARFGTATLALTVDLSAPDAIADLVVVADTRQSLAATWTSPGGASYIVKIATVELTDANFDTTGTVVPSGAPLAAGQPETLTIEPVRTGTEYWVGVAAVDAAGNRSAAAIAGPVQPDFTVTDARFSPNTSGNALLGLSLARGKFNDDEIYDLAVGAPGVDIGANAGAGAVYVYFGTAAGIPATPDMIIEGEHAGGSLGLSLTTVRWANASRDDLVIGEPYSFNVDGRVYVFEGGLATAGTYVASDAELDIGVASTANYFTGGALGWSVAALDFDGDGTDDLALGSVAGGGGNGGVAIVYGGTVDVPTVLLSDASAAGMGGTVAHLIDDPDPTAFDLFANYLHNVGPTASASDPGDDLLISYVDGVNRVAVVRGAATRPTTAGVHDRPFSATTDVAITYDTTDTTTEFGSSAGSIADQNGDGGRDLAIGAYREEGDGGTVFLIEGDVTGTATTATALTAINNGADMYLFGAAIVNNATFAGADVDGDGLEDLVVTGYRGLFGTGEMYVWFGGDIPSGDVYADATVDHVISGPSAMNGWVPTTGGTPHAAIWAGDVNADGLPDIGWGDSIAQGRDGTFTVLH